ncbi:MAG: hypothetical protein ACTHXA_03460 [Gulosibacter sp.]|uniref:hypothetical protein n=1 Tax=Gulosibacter sp. TaxID=2817531 RepID=UPI003F91375A
MGTNRFTALADKRRIYENQPSAEEIDAWQLERFNTAWRKALTDSPFYRQWQETHDLPESIGALTELKAWPVLTKQEIRDNQSLVFGRVPLSSSYITGGSTGEPGRFPAQGSEDRDRFANNYVGRSWWGIGPRDKTGLLWTHYHLHGEGWHRYVSLAERRIKDSIGRMLRLDGGVFDEDALREQARRLLKYRPSHLVGYVSALSRLAGALDVGLREEFGRLKLKGVIGTAEVMTSAQEELLRNVFQCPVIIEYGATETGVLAVSRGTTRNLEVLWHSQLIRVDEGNTILVSTLDERIFPLINFALADTIVPASVSAQGSVHSIEKVGGRVGDALTLGAGENRLTMLAMDLVELVIEFDEVTAVQFSQESPERIAVYVQLSEGGVLADVERHFWTILDRIRPGLTRDAAVFVETPTQQLGRSGKHLVVIAPGTVGRSAE